MTSQSTVIEDHICKKTAQQRQTLENTLTIASTRSVPYDNPDPILITQPKYSPNQEVRFIGGKGWIKQRRPVCGTWFYTIEMELGPEPPIGRLGEEATVLLYEMEILGDQ